MHYPCGENKGADQLRGYHEADLRLCFHICKKTVFSRRSSYVLFYFIQTCSRMSFSLKKFETAGEIEEKKKKRQEEWEKVRKPDDPEGNCTSHL